MSPIRTFLRVFCLAFALIHLNVNKLQTLCFYWQVSNLLQSSNNLTRARRLRMFTNKAFRVLFLDKRNEPTKEFAFFFDEERVTKEQSDSVTH